MGRPSTVPRLPPMLLLVRFGPLRKRDLLERVRTLRALGTTPIAYGLRQTPNDFGPTDGGKLIVLVTDGEEACRGDLAGTILELQQQGFRPTLSVVGFALHDARVKADMRALAEVTGGRYLDAADARALPEAISRPLAAPFEVLGAGGVRVGGAVGDSLPDVPEGVYRVRVAAADRPLAVDNVRVAPDRTTAVLLRKEGEEVGVAVRGGLTASEAAALLAVSPRRGETARAGLAPAPKSRAVP